MMDHTKLRLAELSSLLRTRKADRDSIHAASKEHLLCSDIANQGEGGVQGGAL